MFLLNISLSHLYKFLIAKYLQIIKENNFTFDDFAIKSRRTCLVLMAGLFGTNGEIASKR